MSLTNLCFEQVVVFIYSFCLLHIVRRSGGTLTPRSNTGFFGEGSPNMSSSPVWSRAGQCLCWARLSVGCLWATISQARMAEAPSFINGCWVGSVSAVAAAPQPLRWALVKRSSCTTRGRGGQRSIATIARQRSKRHRRLSSLATLSGNMEFEQGLGHSFHFSEDTSTESVSRALHSCASDRQPPLACFSFHNNISRQK